MNLISKLSSKINSLKELKKDSVFFIEEDLESKKFLEKNIDFSNDIELCFKYSSYKKNYWSISPSAIRYFLYFLVEDSSNKDIKIVEFGSGQSTLFWDKLSLFFPKLSVVTFEHDKDWFKLLSKKVNRVKLFNRDLKQLSDTEFDTIFDSVKSNNSWDSIGVNLTESQYKDTRVKNSFYKVSKSEISSLGLINGLILDGPHGNGRSLAFPLLINNLVEGAIILIDDYDHYPFIEQLGKLYNFKIIKECLTKKKRWIIVKIISKH